MLTVTNLEDVEDGVEEGEELLADGGVADEDGKEPQRDVQVLLGGKIFWLHLQSQAKRHLLPSVGKFTQPRKRFFISVCCSF